MGLIDSHAHLTYPEFEGRIEDVLARCTEAGVDRVITIGTNLSDARKAIELAERYPTRIHAAVGFHPHEADKVANDDLAAMDDLWNHEQVVAFGEMGLDYHYDFAGRGNQKRLFSRQLELASGRGKPLIIHCREALDDVTPMLVDHGFVNHSVVFHCFTGTSSEADRIAEHGWRISFTGIVTFPKSGELREIAKRYPVDQLMVETDSPFLSPVPVRGVRPNDPSHVAHVARFLADLRNVPYSELVEQTSANTKLFFGLG